MELEKKLKGEGDKAFKVLPGSIKSKE